MEEEIVIDSNADYGVLDVAYAFLRLAKEEYSLDGAPSFSDDISNMKLNKLVYFAQVMHVCAYRRALYRDDTRAWDYGPVVPPLYRLLRPFGPTTFSLREQRVEEAFRQKGMHELKSDSTAIEVVRSVWATLKTFSATDLSRMTHQPGTPWTITYRKKPYDVIPLDLMYEKRFGDL